VQGYFRDRAESDCAATSTRPAVPGTGQCYRAYLYRDSLKTYDQDYNDIYLGDTILLGNLTIQAGLRWDSQKERNTATSVAANPLLATPLNLPVPGAGGVTRAWLPALTFPGDARDLKWNTVSPRLGFT
jgi:hypothetical protein